MSELKNKMHYKNNQWMVTDYGIETLPGSFPEYLIDKGRLLQTRCITAGEPMYNWLLHMSEKTWVDLDQFRKAFVEAGPILRPGELNLQILERTLQYLQRPDVLY